MKRVSINTGKIGLVFRNGNYSKMITEGSYWLLPFDEVLQYDMSKPFMPSIELNILLRDESLAKHLTIVEVGDTEIVFQYENGNLEQLLTAGRYAFWKGITAYNFVKADMSQIEIPSTISTNTLQRREVLPFVRIFSVETFEKGILFIDGKFNRMLDAGTYYFWRNAVVISVLKADMRQLQVEVSGQEILTRDKAALRVNFYAQYRVTDIVKALVGSRDFEKQLYILLQLALREFIGTLSLDELLERKDSISEYVINSLKEKTDILGIEIMGAGIRDIILPGEVKEIMNQVLVAEKKAQANVIMRREETASTRSLLNTAKLMEDNAMLFKLKEMEYVEKIAERIGEITVSGNGQILDQLKGVFSVGK